MRGKCLEDPKRHSVTKETAPIHLSCFALALQGLEMAFPELSVYFLIDSPRTVLVFEVNDWVSWEGDLQPRAILPGPPRSQK